MSPATRTLAPVSHPAPLSDDTIAALVARRPDTETFADAVASAAYWTLLGMQKRGVPSAERAEALRRFGEWKSARLAELAGGLLDPTASNQD